MILQSLVRYYDALLERGELEAPGWSPAKVSWRLELSADGTPEALTPLEVPAERNGKTVMTPQIMQTPAPAKRSVNVSANFLCDNASYLLGIDDKGKPERTAKCFEDAKALHETLLSGVEHPAARAIRVFFRTWTPQAAREHPALADNLDNVLKGGNIVFYVDGAYAHRIPALRQAWDESYQKNEGAAVMQCLVTGEQAPIALLHPSVKGVQGAQSSGASLVSFNSPSLESYGCESAQGLNAPVSERAAFAYTAALNDLLSKREHRMRLGDTTLVFWSEDAQPAYAWLFGGAVGNGQVDAATIQGVLRALAAGQNAAWENIPLKPDAPFYVLGLAPNAARLSVRFFLRDTFGRFAEHIALHQHRLDIVRPAYDSVEELSLWALLNETVNQKARDKSPAPQLAGDVARAVLTGGLYPATLYDLVEVRIRAERDVPRGKAAIIKAYLLRNIVEQQPHHPYEEVITVELNEETRYMPYLLGRLFAVLEGLQQSANPGINATIRDKYFSSACATPAVVFPTLVRLAQAHLKKLETGNRVYYDKQITQLVGDMEESYPNRLSLYDQGVFQLGYYHQTQKRYTKKEEPKNV